MNKKMHTWGKMTTQIVELATLAATCQAISGMCHVFDVRRTSKNRVLLTYANPDEYAADHPISCFLPCYFDGDVCWVVMTPTSFRNVGEDWEYDPHQAFTQVWMIHDWTNPNESLTYDQIREVYDGGSL